MIGITKLGLAGLVLGAMPVLASAHPGYFYGHDGGHDAGFGVDIAVAQPAPPPPVIVTAPVDRVWVEPVYQTVTDRVWRDATTEDRCTRVWIPDTVQDQVVHYGRHDRVERVFVPGHYEDRHETVVVAPGHWEDVQRQELVTPGHWEQCGPSRVVEVEPARPSPFLGFFGHFRF